MNWIKSAVKHNGALHRELHIKAVERIPLAKLQKAAHAKGLLGRRARLALTLRKMR